MKIGAATVKVTTEKLPRSLIALDVEIDSEQFAKGLERAARRISQKYNIPGFRKGKAPRFIVENYFGREMLIEEAREDVINKAFQDALKQENIIPIANPNLIDEQFTQEPFTFRVTVPVAPTATLGDYRSLRTVKSVEEVTDKLLERAMESLREKHVVLSELDEPRPAQDGDQLSVELEAIVDGEPLEPRAEGQPITPSTVVLEKDRLVDGLYEGLLGLELNTVRQIITQMPADHTDERLAGKEVTFIANILGMQARVLPEWDELTTLEEFEGTLDELREKTRTDLIASAKTHAERESTDEYVKQLIDASTFDIPDALIEREADMMLKQQEQEYARYGVKPEQVYAYRGQNRDDLVKELLPRAEERIRRSLALQLLVEAEGLTVSEEEIEAQIEENLGEGDEETRNGMRAMLSTQFRSMMADAALDKKLREHMLLLAAGEAPDGPAVPSQADATSQVEVPVEEE